jgi:flagellum-specific peptidoglycan hydrolase FlgJ
MRNTPLSPFKLCENSLLLIGSRRATEAISDAFHPPDPSSEINPLQTAHSRIFSPSLEQKFFQDMAPYAMWTQQMTGVPASVILAQAALESGWGRHAPGNNFFGIKGQGPAGSTLLWTRELHRGRMTRTLARFRRYPSPLESFLDHGRLLSEAPHFGHAMTHTDSPERFIQALQSGALKYATDPHYVEKILSVITRYQLKNYDRIL